MSRELRYQVRLSADTSGAREAADVLGSLAVRSGDVQQVFYGLEMASRGNIASLFGVAKAVQALIRVLSSAGVYVQVLVGVVTAAQIAFRIWQAWQNRNALAAKELSDATDKLTAAQQRLNDVLAAAKAPTYEGHTKFLRDLAEAYSQATSAAAALKDIQDKLADSDTERAVAGIQEQATRESRSAATPEERETIAFNARRQEAQIRYDAEIAALERESKANEGEIERRSVVAFRAGRQSDFEDYSDSTAIKKARAELAALQKDLANFERRSAGAEATPDLIERKTALTEGIAQKTAALQGLEKQYQDWRDANARMVRENKAALDAAIQRRELIPARREQINARFTADETRDWSDFQAQEQARRDQESQRQADAAKKDAQQQARSQAESQSETVKARAEQQKETIARQIQDAGRTAELADQEAARLTQRIMSPAVRRAQDKEERQQQREARKLQNRLDAADAAEKRGARGGWISDVRSRREALNLAAEKKREMADLEHQAWKAQVDSAGKLDAIKTVLEANLRAAG